jgi:hypothetical protein
VKSKAAFLLGFAIGLVVGARIAARRFRAILSRIDRSESPSRAPGPDAGFDDDVTRGHRGRDRDRRRRDRDRDKRPWDDAQESTATTQAKIPPLVDGP